ncbi:hypothetical protein thsrh120_60720 [Rhizobium sp. No.120]
MSDEKKMHDDSQTSKGSSFGSALGPDFRPLGRRIKVKVGDRTPKPILRKPVSESDDNETG